MGAILAQDSSDQDEEEGYEDEEDDEDESGSDSGIFTNIIKGKTRGRGRGRGTPGTPTVVKEVGSKNLRLSASDKYNIQQLIKRHNADFNDVTTTVAKSALVDS